MTASTEFTSASDAVLALIRKIENALRPEDLVDQAATIIINRVRKRFLNQENPDGAKWPQSRSAQIRLAGGFTKAEGGKYAPGGLKTGTGTLFASGNLFHSIQLVKTGQRGERSVRTDTPYAEKYNMPPWDIMGVSLMDQNTVLQILRKRVTDALHGK